MWVSKDFCLVRIGVRVSLTPYIKSCISVMDEHKLDYELLPKGTAIEGEWVKVFQCIKNCHKLIHSKYIARV